jgi:hypothetical protein
MNTIVPVFEKLRAFCLTQLQSRGLVRARKSRRMEIQLEFHWR